MNWNVGRLPITGGPVVCMALHISHGDASYNRTGHEPQGGWDYQRPGAHCSPLTSAAKMDTLAHIRTTMDNMSLQGWYTYGSVSLETEFGAIFR